MQQFAQLMSTPLAAAIASGYRFRWNARRRTLEMRTRKTHWKTVMEMAAWRHRLEQAGIRDA